MANKHFPKTQAPASPDEARMLAVGDHTVILSAPGGSLQIPKGMTFKEAQKTIGLAERMSQENKTKCGVFHTITCIPTDGVYAFWCAIRELCGFASAVPTPSLFGDIPPKFITIPSDAIGGVVNAIIGRFMIPELGGVLSVGIKVGHDENIKIPPATLIQGEVSKDKLDLVNRIIARAEELVMTKSLYRGKAVRVSYDYVLNERSYDFTIDSPVFMSISDGLNYVLDAEVAMNIDSALFGRVSNTKAYEENDIPIKCGVLLSGGYGTGKTLTAHKLAAHCARNGWTFMYLDDVRSLATAYRLAKMYEPCVLFAEDLDRATDGSRDSDLDNILNTIDGIEFKDAKIITVFTTNHPEKVHPAMMRPGRIDNVIEMRPPSVEAASDIIAAYGGSGLDDNFDFKAAANAVRGLSQSSIREVVERAKSYALSRSGYKSALITSVDIVSAAAAIRNHIEYTKRNAEPKDRDLASALKDVYNAAISGD